jgi:hypothetical protein
MKTLLRLASILVLAASLARAEDWKTTDGQTYQEVKVLAHDDGYVTIMYADGGARVPLSTLPPDLQKRFDYDPVRAAAAVAATTAADKRDQAARLQEKAGTPHSVAAVQNPSPSSPPLNVIPARRPSTSPTGTGASSVDVLGNNMRIEEDMGKLDGLDQDLRRAQRDATQEDAWSHTGEMHYDNSGVSHPNRVGESGDDRVAKIQKEEGELRDEIAQLKQENISVTQTGK